MLGRSYTTAVPFAEDLVKRGIRLTVLPNSVLSELTNMSAPVEFETVVPSNRPYEEEVTEYGHLVEGQTMGLPGQIWGISFDTSVERLAGVIKSQIGYIRNTIVPRVQEFVKDSEVFIQELGSTNPAAELTITKVSVPEIATDGAFLALLEPFKFKTPLKPNSKTLGFPFTSIPEDFNEVISLSNGRLDSLVMEWCKSCDMQYVKSAWFSFFAGTEMVRKFDGPFVDEDDMESPSLHVRLNLSLAYFLLANYYYNHMPDIVTSESTDSIKRRLYDHMAYAGATLCETISRMEQHIKNDILVLYADKFHKRIIVSDEVYTRWLAAGGDVDIIMGVLVGNRSYYSVPEIDAHCDELKQDWHSYSRVYLENIEFRKGDTLREFYSVLFMKYLTSDYRDSLEESAIAGNSYVHDGLAKKATEWLYTQKKDQLCDSQYVAKKLIAGMKYHFTYAEKFISDIDDLGKCGEHMVVEEAAFVATVNYIVDYLHGQLQVVKS